MKKYLWLFVLFFCVLASSCGKISSPEAVPNSGYPHTYPYR